MGCNCGKGSRVPGPRQAPRPAPSRVRGAPTPAPPKKSGTKDSQTFVLTDRRGNTQRFGSELEARAALVRAGGGSIRRVN